MLAELRVKRFSTVLVVLVLSSLGNTATAETRQAGAARIEAYFRALPYPPPPVDEKRRQEFIAERFKEANALVESGRTDGRLFRLLVSDLQREGANEELRRLGVTQE